MSTRKASKFLVGMLVDKMFSSVSERVRRAGGVAVKDRLIRKTD